MRLVYRLIFLITAEERGVLHAVRDTPETRRYAEGYSLRRLRERGALAIELEPRKLSTGLVNRYLEVKERNLL